MSYYEMDNAVKYAELIQSFFIFYVEKNIYLFISFKHTYSQFYKRNLIRKIA